MAEFFIVVEADDADAEAVFDDRLIHIEHFAVRIVATVRLLKRDAVFAEVGDFELVVDDARRTAEAEEDGVGAARDVDALGVVGIEADVGREKIAREIGAAETTDARGDVGALEVGLGVGEIITGAHAGVIAADARGFGAGRVDEDVLGVGRAGIDEELGIDDADGRADVAEFGAQARAGECGGGLVPFIGIGLDDEGREGDQLGGRWRGDGLGGGGDGLGYGLFFSHGRLCRGRLRRGDLRGEQRRKEQESGAGE